MDFACVQNDSLSKLFVAVVQIETVAPTLSASL